MPGPDSADRTSLNRRRLLGLGVAGVAALGFVPRSAWATTLGGDTRTLGFFNTHTGEILKAAYWRGGAYDKGAVKDIFHILRDFRTGEVSPIDLNLLDLLVELHRNAHSRRPFEIISGYRSPQTNTQLASASSGVAKRSLHLVGKAIDIRLADVPLKELRQTALAMQAGGVGYYPGSNFIHVDTGRVRHW